MVVGVVFPAMDGVIEIGDHAEKAFALWGAEMCIRDSNLAAVLAHEYAVLVPRIRYIKVDAEGYDATVLSTLTSVIAQTRPPDFLASRPTLPCFVGGRPIGRFTLDDCASRNGVALSLIHI